MKKALSVFLAVLMIFSVFGVTTAFAEEEKTYYTVTFIYIQGTEEITETFTVAEGETVIAPDYPVRDNTPEMKYIFKGWKAEGDDNLYHQNTIPPVTGDITYTAVYSEQAVEETITFFGLISYIFSQFNRIFEQIAKYLSDIFQMEV